MKLSICGLEYKRCRSRHHDFVFGTLFEEMTKQKNTKKARRQRSTAETDRSIHYAKIFEGTDKDGRNPKRVVTIAYRVYPERPGMNVEFAASMFRKDNDKEEYNRRNHVATARGRLAVRPLYTTFVFSDDVLDNLLEKNVPKSKDERRVWAKSETGQQWKQARRDFDQKMAKFLRKEVGRCGVGAKQRSRRSEIERARASGIVPRHDGQNNEEYSHFDLTQWLSSMGSVNGNRKRHAKGRIHDLNALDKEIIANLV